MTNEFTEVMSSKSDQELINIARNLRDQYQPEAMIAVDREIEIRNLDINKVESIIEEIEIIEKKQESLDSLVVGSLIRLIHLIIDSLVIFILWGILTSVINILFSYPHNIFIGFSGILLFALTYLGYYAVLEYKYQKTVAKFVTKTKVIMLDEQEPQLADILKRSLFRLIPFDRFSYIFTKRGFHDYLSHTIVIKDQQ